MKNKIKNILFIMLILIVSGCSKGTKNEPNIIINDQKIGYKTTFNYPENKGYKVKVNQKFPVEVELSNDNLNFKATIYYYETTFEIYNKNKIEKAHKNNYKEYTFDKYKAYSYVSNEIVQSNILLTEKDKNNMVLVLYINMKKLDNSKNTNLNNIFISKEFQDILKTINFSEKKSN